MDISCGHFTARRAPSMSPRLHTHQNVEHSSNARRPDAGYVVPFDISSGCVGIVLGLLAVFVQFHVIMSSDAVEIFHVMFFVCQ